MDMDNLLTDWLQASDESEAAQYLTHLITAEIEPLIKTTIYFKLRLAHSTPEAEDLRQESLAELLRQLQLCHAQPEKHAIGDVRALAATITYRVCYRWLRRQSPRRNALRNRLHYVLTRDVRLALWNDLAQVLLSGFASWRGRKDRARAAQLQQLADDETLQSQAGKMASRPGVAAFGSWLCDVFNQTELPVALDDLTLLSASLLQIRDEPSVSTTDEEGLESLTLVAADDVALHAEQRIFLQRLWEEAQTLPLPQRTAILLNLRDAGGCGCIALFPALGIASMRQLAAVLEIPLDEFAALWNEMPLDDATIAARLQLTRQQVINARKAGRERLARRLRGFF